jgi:nitroimidazol reductase NimA-like FMN-containing flavoprotein (pyridoxamine 5'-phosphate oxidase superfamily)
MGKFSKIFTLMGCKDFGGDMAAASRITTWPQLVATLDRAASYWLATTDPAGAPHAAPVWGVAHGTRFFLYSSRTSRKVRNVQRDPHVVLHLPSTEDVVIVHGVAQDLGEPREWPEVLRALERKYATPEERAYLPSADDSYDVLLELIWQRALGWNLADYEHSFWRLSRDSSPNE